MPLAARLHGLVGRLAEAGAWSDPHECEPCRKF
jgi:hypothetical protein